MKRPPPPFEPRGRAELTQALLARARSWIPEWQPADPAADPGVALLRIAARVESEVTRRLAQVPQKSYRGLLAWLGVRGQSGSAARVPVAFRLNPNAAPLDVDTPVQMRAPASDESVMLEVRDVLNLRASSIVTMIAADESADRWFRAPPGLFSLDPPAAVPGRWNLLARASEKSTRLQLDPRQGLARGDVLLDEHGNEYEIATVKDGLVSVAPPVRAGGLNLDAALTRAQAFRSFDEGANNQQKHELYFGADRLFDVKDSVVFEVLGDGALSSGATWSFLGMPDTNDGVPAAEPDWRDMKSVTFDGRLLLLKKKGEIVKHELWDRKTRWIRAIFTVKPSDAHRAADALKLRIVLAGAPDPDEQNGIEAYGREVSDWFRGQRASVELQGIAGTAPLVMNNAFYPLGVEPRLFDAFYLGSNEAFSKHSARVKCHFDLGDRLVSPAAALDDDTVVAIGADGRLHVMRGVKAPEPENEKAVATHTEGKIDQTDKDKKAPEPPRAFVTQPRGENGRPVTLDTYARPGVLKMNGGTYRVTVSRGSEVWLLRHDLASPVPPDAWLALQSLPEPPGNGGAAPQKGAITVLTGLGTGSESRVYALWRDELYYGDPTGSSFAWTLVDGINGKPAMIVPILQYGNPLPRPEDTDGLLCVTKDGKVFIGSATNGWTKLTAPKLDSDTWPLALKSTDTVYCMSKAHSDDHASDAPLIAFSFSTANPNAGLRVRTSPGRLTIKDNAFAFAWRSVASASAAAQQRPVAVFLAQENSTRAAAWYAFEDGKSSLIYADQPIGVSEFAHAPVTLTQSQIAFPVGSDRVEIAQVNAEPQTVGERLNLHFAVEVPELATSAETLYVRVTAANQGAYLWTMGDKVSVMNTKRTLRVLWNRGDATSGSARHRIEFFRPEGEKRTFTLVDDAPGELRMDETSGIEAGCIVRLWNANDGGHLLRIVKGVEDGTPKTVKLDKEIDARHRNVEFLERLEGVHDKKGLLRPALRRGDLSAEISGNIANARFTLLDEKSKPIGQKNMHALDTDGSPWIVFAAAATDRSLAARFASIQMLNFFRGWVPRTASRDIDPKLSWEYWNGRSWTVLPITADETDNLLTSGKIEFEVRSDAQPTEVLGQPNHWIRARLVGGDYGQAKYITSDAANPHTVVRDPSGIHPPYVTRVQVHYEIEEGVTPDHLITLDGGVARDQSEANLTPNAIVEYAVPLADQLAHLADDAPHTRNKAGLAIYLGLDRELSGPGITLLFDVVDGAFDDAGPLQAEALIDGVFRTLMSKDGTRGLSESGIVTLALADPPQRALLFGATALHWLRFRPDPRANRETWKPRIKGVYLNAAMAVAAETVTLERLGSSDGSPGQSVVLAKTPVLQDSLVLRVREPIDEADVRRLASDGVDIVDTLGHWPGFWVRWREVPDLLGSGKQDRVYTLEDDTGRIRFGDGIRGRIPPTGADSIVAVTYRLGGGAVANGITAFSEVSLVTPLAGVQGVVTLDDAAGGIDPEDADATLSYASANLAMRDRAVTLRDFEQLTRQLVPNLAQVRARAYAHGIEIVFAMRGDEPRPTRAARRELQAALLSRADPALARPRALQAIGPNIVDARLDLKLLIDAGGPGAAIAQQAVERVTALLDPATGGLDASGWRFGTLPSGTELAASLDGISGLIALESSGLRTAGAPGVAPERIATLGRDDALRVAPSAVHIELTRARESS